MTQPTKNLTIIGSVDKIDLPEFGFSNIKCKIDTGAFTSSIHCSETKIEFINGEEILSFKLFDEDHKQYQDQWMRVNSFSNKEVKSSNGQVENRFVVNSYITLFGETHEIDFTLADRSTMNYPILLGKAFLYGKFLVDVSLENLSFKLKKSVS